MKKIFNLLKIFGGVLVIVCSFYYGYNYLNSLFRTKEADYNDGFHNMPENSVDVIVLGSSHAQYSFVPSFFYEDTGLYSYSLGTPVQPVSVSYEMLKEALKTQKPELVIMEIFTAAHYDDNSNPESDYRYVMAEYQLTGEERHNVIDMISSKEKALTYKNEFLNNHNNWRTVESLDSLITKSTYVDGSLGFIGEWSNSSPYVNYWYSVKYEEDLDLELPEEVVTGLNNILNLCKENDIDLLLYMTPMDNVTQEEQTYRHKVWDWANENDVKYIDMLGNDEKLDFRSVIHHDGYHTFINGASYATDLLANFVKEKYTFDNHKDNEFLNEKCKENLISYSLDVLEREVNPNKYLYRYINSPATILVSYKQSRIDENLRTFLDEIGLSVINDSGNYYAILKNGELLACDQTNIEYTIDDNNVVINDSGIYFNGELIADDDLITFVMFSSDYTRKSIKVIDYLDDKMWDKDYNYDYNYTKEVND